MTGRQLYGGSRIEWISKVLTLSVPPLTLRLVVEVLFVEHSSNWYASDTAVLWLSPVRLISLITEIYDLGFQFTLQSF